MTDPYNSYQSFRAADRAPATPATPPRAPDNISGLNVSDKWKNRFRAIEQAGGPGLPNLLKLPASERRGLQLNWLALFFGPFYFLAKGLWRQTIVYLAAAIACVLIMEFIGLGKFSRGVGHGFSIIYALRANVSYYRRVVLGEAPWA